MDIYCLKSLVKTWIGLCFSKEKIINNLIMEYSLNPREASKLYLDCLVEMGH